MPISFAEKIRPISQQRFHEIDFAVMALAFDVQRDVGNSYLNEHVYQAELAHRCAEAGFESVAVEEPVSVSFGSFCKTYSIDLLIDNIAVYELKSAEAICAEHRAQTLNYLLMTGLCHGKLVNFGPQRVDHQFVSTQLTRERRESFHVEKQHWLGSDHDSASFEKLVESLAHEWGTFLDIGLYTEAVTHFRGGEDVVVRPVEIHYRSRPLGKLNVHLVSADTAFKITAFTREISIHENALRRFLNLTSLQRLQWVNFNHHKIEFRTVLRTP